MKIRSFWTEDCKPRIYITLRTDSPPCRLPLEALSQPLSALSAVSSTTGLYNCRQSRRREVGRVLSTDDEGGGLTLLSQIYMLWQPCTIIVTLYLSVVFLAFSLEVQTTVSEAK